MNPLEALLRPVANVLNRNILATTPARELCEKLDGKVVAIRVRDTALAAWFIIESDGIILSLEHDDEPDLMICGSLLTLARMSGAPGTSELRTGALELAGDTHVAADFQQLLKLAKPDLEEELSSFVGDAAAHRIGTIARSLGQWGRDARATMGANIREYLQEESREAPSRYEVDRLAEEVARLRDDVERFEARLRRLKAGR